PMPVSSRALRNVPSMRPTVGKFWMPAMPRLRSWSRKGRSGRVGSVAQTPQRRGVVRRSGSVSLACEASESSSEPAGLYHLQHDIIGVAVGHEAGERAASVHPIPTAVVDDDEVSAARFDRLGRQSDPYA